jgi:hypothetical protein
VRIPVKHVAVAFLAACPIGSAAGQTIRGTLLDEANAPIRDVVVMLVAADGSTLARTLSGSRGDFTLSAGADGAYRLRALRLGFRPWTSKAFGLRASEPLVQRFIVTGARFVLDTLRVAARGQCRMVGGEVAASVASVWEQVQAALTVAELTITQRPFVASTLNYERDLDRTGAHVLAQQSSLSRGRVTQPWASVSPEQLHARGYVAIDSDSTAYAAPGLEALLSPWFLQDHCLRVASSRDSPLMGIEFEPIAARRRIPEVSGTLWLDRATSTLSRLTFRFVNVSRLQQEHAGGEMSFMPLRDGGWAISRWVLRMPALELSRRRMPAGNFDPEIIVGSIRQVGGELLVATATNSAQADTLWSRQPSMLTGTVTDAASALPIPGARVLLSGTSLTATSDSQGRFVVDNVIAGGYTIEVRTDALDLKKRMFRTAVTLTDSVTSVVLRSPAASTALVAAENLADSVALAARRVRKRALVGSVLATSKEPIGGAELSLPELALTVRSQPDGTFRFPEVPPGRHRFAVRSVGYGPLDATVEITDRANTTRTIFLSRFTTLDSVRVEADRGLSSFEDHRRTGLGKFLTRDDLAAMENRSLGAVFAGMSGVQMMRGANNRTWIASARRQSTFSGLDESDRKSGAKPGCYAQVYLDNMRVYGGKAGESLFDMNSLSPDRVEAIEYYSSPATTPAKYSGLGATCGVVVLWSRRSP